jgi:Ca2+-dependent lipid-binding protein
MPSLPVVLLLAIPITLAYLRVSFVTLLLGLLFSWYIWAEWKRKKTKRTDFGPEVDRAKAKGLNAKWEHEHYNEESVFWMNHALRALFPLINTDILTPFIDLVEDALLTQVPPIIVSNKERRP